MDLQLFRKIGDEIYFVYNPNENVEVGDNFKIIDRNVNRGILVQVIEVNLIDLPGILTDVLRREVSSSLVNLTEIKSKVMEPLIDIRNMRIARAKIRKEILFENGVEVFSSWSGWTPSRACRIEKVSPIEIASKMNIGFKYEIEIGNPINDNNPIKINASDLQGINIIVGKKGSGKSHLAKIILLGIIRHGAKAIVFDINDEYSGLKYTENGGESEYYDKIITLEPNPTENSEYVPLKFTLKYIGLNVIYRVLTEVLGLPEASAYTFRNIWIDLERNDNLYLDLIYDMAEDMSPKIAGAITRRIETIESTGIITSNENECTRIEKLLERIDNGGALIINLKAKGSPTQEIVVQTILSKIEELLENEETEPLFIFAEEAHLYLERTVWINLVTRMRHLGAYQFYMTNTPQSIDEIVIRQCDNIFIFNLTDKKDIWHIIPAAKIDEETISAIVKSLPPKQCLAIGIATREYPFIIETRELPYITAGKTKLLWEI